jgi:hypothetical protein
MDLNGCWAAARLQNRRISPITGKHRPNRKDGAQNGNPEARVRDGTPEPAGRNGNLRERESIYCFSEKRLNQEELAAVPIMFG